MAWTEQQWIAEGRAIILALLEYEAAVVWPEVEARAAERSWLGFRRVDPNHLLTARDELLRSGEIARTPGVPTRGGRRIDVFHLPVVVGRNATRISRVGARKRLLQARWTGWAMGDARYPSGLVGSAGEQVARDSLSASPPHLYAPVQANYGPVASVLGAAVVSGALDSAAWCFSRHEGLVGRPVLLPIEVKNLREWLFPDAPQVHQVLHKAAALSAADATTPLVPTLICRRRHITTLYMAQDLGFFVIEVKKQWLAPSNQYSSRELMEVRNELGYEFLSVAAGPDPLLVKILRETLPGRAEAAAERWSAVGARFGAEYAVIVNDRLPATTRRASFEKLRAGVMRSVGARGGW